MIELEGDDEGIQKMLDGLSIEQRLAGLAPEQVLAMYDDEQVLLALPDKALRSLSEDYIATLSKATRAAVRARIGSENMEYDGDIRKLEGYDEIVQKIKEWDSEEIEARKQQIRVLVGCLPPDHALAGLTPEQVLAAYRSDPASVSITLEQLLAGLTPQQASAIFTPEQLLAGLTIEQRLADLTPEQKLLAMPVVVLRGMSDDYIATLSEPTRAAIRARTKR